MKSSELWDSVPDKEMRYLVKHFGGKDCRVTVKDTENIKVNCPIFHKLFVGNTVYVPSGNLINKKIRNASIIAEVDKMISEKISVSHAVNVMVDKYGISSRMIWRILKGA